MPKNWSQYKTAASGEIEAMLQSSNSVIKVLGYDSAGTSYLIYATTSGISAVTRTSAGVSSKMGYFAQANINDLAVDDTYLYVAHATNIGRIALADLFVADSDVSGDYTSTWGSDSTLLAVAGYPQTAIATGYLNGAWYIATNHNGRVVRWSALASITARASVETWGIFDLKIIENSTSGTTALFAVTALGVYGYLNPHTGITASNWKFASSLGNLDDDFTDGVVETKWYERYSNTNCTLSMSEAGGALKMQIVNNSAAAGGNATSGLTLRDYLLSGDFVVQFTGVGGYHQNEPAVGGETITRNCYFRRHGTTTDTGNYAEFRLVCTYGATRTANWTGNIAVDSGGGSSVVDTGSYAETYGSIATYGTGKMFRISRTGNTMMVEYNLNAGGGWVELATYSSNNLLGPMHMLFYVQSANMADDTIRWDIEDLSNTSPEQGYAGFPEQIALTGMDAVAPAAVLDLVVATESDGIRAVGPINESDPPDSLVASFGVSGYDYDIMTENDCTCIAGQIDGSNLYAWVGLSTLGIDRIELVTQTGVNFTEVYGKIIDDAVVCIAAVGSAAYGGASGGGFLTGDTTPPGDTNLYLAGRQTNAIVAGWIQPSDSDFHHSKLYRRRNGGVWDYFKTDYTWGTSGAAYEFAETITYGGKRLALNDYGLSDGKYEYKTTQFDDVGNESAGTISDAEYIDQPVVSISVYGGATTTTTRGIRVSVSGNSGSDSGAETSTGALRYIDISESNSFLAENTTRVNVVSRSQSFILPWHLSTGDGLKTIYARGVTLAGNVSGTASCTITLDEAGAPVVTAYSVEDNCMIAKEISSDTSDVLSIAMSDADSDFPAANMRDQRLTRVARPTTWDDISSEYGARARAMVSTMTFSQAETIDIAYIKNHNLSVLAALGLCQIYLWGSTTPYGVVDLLGNSAFKNWKTSAEYEAHLTNLIGAHSIIHRPEVSYRYWAIGVFFKPDLTEALTEHLPYIGRFILIKSDDIWQPQPNFSLNYEERLLDESIILEAEDQAFEANEKRKRYNMRLSFSPLTNARWRVMRRIFQRFGRSSQIFVLLAPSEIDTGTNKPGANSYLNWTFPPMLCHIRDDFSLRGLGNGHGEFSVELLEDIGDDDPYGV